MLFLAEEEAIGSSKERAYGRVFEAEKLVTGSSKQKRRW
jgi:hypothetical protein